MVFEAEVSLEAYDRAARSSNPLDTTLDSVSQERMLPTGPAVWFLLHRPQGAWQGGSHQILTMNCQCRMGVYPTESRAGRSSIARSAGFSLSVINPYLAYVFEANIFDSTLPVQFKGILGAKFLANMYAVSAEKYRSFQY